MLQYYSTPIPFRCEKEKAAFAVRWSSHVSPFLSHLWERNWRVVFLLALQMMRRESSKWIWWTMGNHASMMSFKGPMTFFREIVQLFSAWCKRPRRPETVRCLTWKVTCSDGRSVGSRPLQIRGLVLERWAVGRVTGLGCKTVLYICNLCVNN